MVVSQTKRFPVRSNYRILIVAAILCAAISASAYGPTKYWDDEEGRRHFHITPNTYTNEFLKDWGIAHVWLTGNDVFEFEESDDPYVGVFEHNKNMNASYVGVKSDGSPADPSKVVFVQAEGASGEIICNNLTNLFANITFSNVPLAVRTAAPFIITNCVFTDTGIKQAIRAVDANAQGFITAIDCRFKNIVNTQGAVNGARSFVATNCVFSCITNTYGGRANGGVIQNVTNVTLSCCMFANCHLDGAYGGVIAMTKAGSVLNVDRCFFIDNDLYCNYSDRSPAGGGAIFVNFGTATIRNCLFKGNKVSRSEIDTNGFGGGAIMLGEWSSYVDGAVIDNCTFIENVAEAGGKHNIKGSGAILVTQSNQIGITNCVFHANRGLTAAASNLYLKDWTLVSNCLESNFEYGGTTYDFSMLDTGETPTTHIVDGVNGNKVGDYDPKFTDAANGDYTLQKNSDCRDAGATLAWMNVSSLDLAGKARVVGEAPDIGCFEWFSDNIGLSIIVR